MKHPSDSIGVQRLLADAALALERLDSHGIEPAEVVQMLESRKAMHGVPVSIFNPELGALESIVKYLREELLLSYDAIAALLHRNPGPIGVTYRRAREKHEGRLDASSSEVIPFSVFRDSRFSVLESISYYLLQQGHDWHSIAGIMCRNDKTIWTVLDRARRKKAGR